jgi:hypothetical protein
MLSRWAWQNAALRCNLRQLRLVFCGTRIFAIVMVSGPIRDIFKADKGIESVSADAIYLTTIWAIPVIVAMKSYGRQQPSAIRHAVAVFQGRIEEGQPSGC